MKRLLAPATAALLAACATAEPQASSSASTDTAAGRQLYARHCLACHQADGYGVPNMQPAIAGGAWVQGDPRALAMFVMTGGFDSESRKDSDNGNVMPPFVQLPDQELAAILTFIRAEFGKGASPVGAAEVAAARADLPK